MFRFDVDGQQRYLLLDDGRVVLSDSGPQPDLVIDATSAALSAVARGETNLNTAVMSGKIKVVGDMAYLLVLGAVLDGAPDRAAGAVRV